MIDDFVKEIDYLRCEKEQLNSLVNSCQEEIRQLKKQVEELERGKWVKDSRKQIENKLIEDIDNVETLSNILNYLGSLYLSIDNQLYKIKTHKKQQKEFINYLKDEKDRLARECSNIYEDSLGETRLVNEDIFNEVNDILQKYKSIIGVSDDKK